MASGSITTPVDLISLCLKTAGVIGIGQTADAADTADCFAILNAMLGQWARERYLIWELIDVSHTSTGAQSYTVGTGGHFDVTRPDRLEAAYVRLLTGNPNSPFDYPMMLIDSREDYSTITLKKLVTFPSSVFYDSAYPTANVFFWPVPNTQFELHIVVKEPLSQFASLTTSITLPPEFIDALVWNLSVRIRPLYQLQPDPTIVALAKASLNVIRQANAQVAQLRLPGELLKGGGGYDPTLGNLNGLPWAI